MLLMACRYDLSTPPKEPLKASKEELPKLFKLFRKHKSGNFGSFRCQEPFLELEMKERQTEVNARPISAQQRATSCTRLTI